jgi:hypothetical protein
LHPEREKWVRAKRLGADYEMEGLEIEFARQTERTETKTVSHSKGWGEFERDTRATETKRAIERQNARDREITTEQKQEGRRTHRKTRSRNYELEL